MFDDARVVEVLEIVEIWMSTEVCENERGTSGVNEEQLESELSDDLTVGVLAREFDVVVFEEREREDLRSSGCEGGCDSSRNSCEGDRSSSITSTTLPSGATTS